MGQENLVEVDFGADVVVGWTREAGWDGRFVLEEPEGFADDLEDFDGGHR